MIRLPLLSLVGAVVLAAAGCERTGSTQISLQERLLPRANPTSYEFEANISETKAAIQRAYDDWHYETSKNYGERTWRGEGDAVSRRVYSRALQLIGHELLVWREGDALANGLLSKPGNENDAYLSGQEAPFCESEVYFKDGQPLIYYADFQIHLAGVGPKRTRVEILTYGSKVAVGVDKRFSPVHGPGFFLLDVAPTTVEEYQILLKIGEQLGAKEMPKLVAPGPDSAVRQITKPRPR